MLSKRRILTKLAVGTNRTATALFSEEQLDEFASFYKDKWDEGVSTDVVAESFVDFFWDDEKPCRRCSVCGNLMRAGYYSESQGEYYCCDECLRTEFTPEKWEKECNKYKQSGITQW